ncbi:acyltransferase family protein, partial [Neobacillus drentensis]|uniref:acyltransferase family protein n=1 Tax=Neobacillus drentensis TaxID=220684 RepID=UPI002FFDC0D5
MEKKLVNEIFLMRTISCLSILLLHSLARAYAYDNNIVNLMQLLLTFGTPTFVFISEFILARSYPQELPANFWSKRLKFIMVPYILFGTFYALMKGFEQSLSSGNDFLGSFGGFLWKHILLGDYHGYFILVIFQFYLLHYF